MDNSQAGTPAKSAPPKKFLFLCGTPRSGTTALATLLNHHPHIYLGIERYKGLKRPEFNMELFSADRFFDVRAGDTNSRVATHSESREKFAAALWVGDKVPRYYAMYDVLLSRFPECKILYILRDIHAVAESWNKRARDPKDRWPAENDYRRAVIEWNSSLKVTLENRRKYRSQFILVNYDDLFSGNTLVLRRMLVKLGLSAPKEMLKTFARMTKDWSERRARKLGTEEEQAFIQANADVALYEQVKLLAISAKKAELAQ